MTEDVDDTFQTWVVSHVGNLPESSISPAGHENISLWHALQLTTALQLILRKDNVGSRCYQAPLLGSESGRALGILPTANLQRHWSSSLSKNGTQSHVFPWLHNNSCGWRCVADWCCSLQYRPDSQSWWILLYYTIDKDYIMICLPVSLLTLFILNMAVLKQLIFFFLLKTNFA